MDEKEYNIRVKDPSSRYEYFKEEYDIPIVSGNTNEQV